MEIAIVLGLLILAIILFATDKVSVDIVTIGLLIVLTSIGILTPEEAFRGFGSDFIIMLASIFVLGACMQKAGILEIIGEKFSRISSQKVKWLPTYIMATVGFSSAFMNNTTVTAMFISPVMGIARKLRMSPSKLLLPVAFASILGGTCTLIGTSTNIAVNAYLRKHTSHELGMFDFTLIGLAITVTGIAFMALFGIKMLPGQLRPDLLSELEQNNFFTEISIGPKSSMVGQKVRDSVLSRQGFKILNIIRDHQNSIASGYSVIETGDRLLVEGNFEELLRLRHNHDFDLYTGSAAVDDMITDDIKIVEIFVSPSNDFIGQTIREAEFKRRFGLLVLAVNREGQTFSEQIQDIKLKVGDRLLLQGPASNIEFRDKRGDFNIINQLHGAKKINKRNAILSGSFFVGAILIGSLNIIPQSIAFMLAAFLCVLFKVIKPDEAYGKIEWSLLVLIGGMSSFGTAMEKTGTASFLADNIIHIFGGMGPIAVLAAFALLTVFLTQPLSNAAAAMVVLPVALTAANTLHVNELTFAVTVMLSASVSLITPFEPSCILVYGPGNYKFMDFFKTGILITLLLMVIILTMVPWMYPLY